MDQKRLLYRAAEAARLTGLSKQYVYQLAAEGGIPCIRIGRSVRFPADALEAWIQRLTDEQVRESGRAREVAS